jgi:hypothetical protein
MRILARVIANLRACSYPSGRKPERLAGDKRLSSCPTRPNSIPKWISRRKGTSKGRTRGQPPRRIPNNPLTWLDTASCKSHHISVYKKLGSGCVAADLHEIFTVCIQSSHLEDV